MPDPKKIMVKVPKKSNPETEEAKKGIYDKETAADNRDELSKAGLNSAKIKEIDKISAFNKKKVDVERMATNDSIVGANKAKIQGLDIVDQKRAGNKEANATRVKEGNPQVLRGRTMTKDSEYTDKYASDGNKPSVDVYSRAKPLEKDMPVIKKTFIKVKKK